MYVINHINHDKTDNRLTNLEIVDKVNNAKQWAKIYRSSKAGRKRSGFCGRGHKLLGDRVYCLECGRLKNKNLKIEPPSEYLWKNSSVEGYMVSNTGLVWSKKSERILKAGINKPGYMYVNLRIGFKTKNYSISRLVYDAFVGPIPKGMVVDHLNSNKLDNKLENLRILSKKDNSKASRDKIRDNNRNGFKLTEKTVAEIKWLLSNSNLRQIEIADKYGLVQSTISAIKLGYQWSHIKPKAPNSV